VHKHRQKQLAKQIMQQHPPLKNLFGAPPTF